MRLSVCGSVAVLPAPTARLRRLSERVEQRRAAVAEASDDKSPLRQLVTENLAKDLIAFYEKYANGIRVADTSKSHNRAGRQRAFRVLVEANGHVTPPSISQVARQLLGAR